ncbi:hypothetical protein DFH06DRAFT_208026 [Mycena polygramma]|nr:hypothetical protein DFH06DRAFT_208026 [Mycena polygramma]
MDGLERGTLPIREGQDQQSNPSVNSYHTRTDPRTDPSFPGMPTPPGMLQGQDNEESAKAAFIATYGFSPGTPSIVEEQVIFDWTHNWTPHALKDKTSTDQYFPGTLPGTPPIVKEENIAKNNAEHEAAAAKLWAVYVSEAEKYDRGLVESWKSDMEGMLIFAGLFSASLTAFLIESYKTLNPDSGGTTVLLLAQISQQLAASANGTTFPVPPSLPFTPPTSSLVCNILWFISLGLSLTCALVATLLEQWARDFIHRVDMRSAPVVRARVFSFLYYGLKRFKMHTVVEIIPLLLHASLFLFFVGLVAFLLPVNTALTIVVGIILGTVTLIYMLLTLLPLAHLECPYRTPLSRGFWTLRQSVQTMLNRRYTQPVEPTPQREDENMVEMVFRKAMEPSLHRSSRDTQALIWTVKSLADDNELQPFVEAIPDVIWVADSTSGVASGRRYVYDEQMRHLMQHPNVQLLRRLKAFAHSCSGLLTEEERGRRQVCFSKAVWALGCLSTPGGPPFPLSSSAPGQRKDFVDQPSPQVLLCTISADAIVQWANMRAAQPLLDDALRLFAECPTDTMNTGFDSTAPVFTLLSQCFSKLAEYRISASFSVPSPFYDTSSRAWLRPQVHDFVQQIHTLPHCIFVEYLARAAASDVIPYQFATTCSLTRPTTQIPRSAKLQRTALHTADTMMRTHRDLFKTDQHEHWLDDVFSTMLSYWKPNASDSFSWAVLEMSLFTAWHQDCQKTHGKLFRRRLSLISILQWTMWKTLSLRFGSCAVPILCSPTKLSFFLSSRRYSTRFRNILVSHRSPPPCSPWQNPGFGRH